MWQYLFLVLRRQKGRSILVSGGFLLAACTLILLSATTQTTVLQANQIISQKWRPTYDLVVLPPQAKIPVGKAVPADLMEGYGGGISVSQYEQIKKLPGVEVAAPIAYVGYAQLPSPEVAFSPHTLPPGYYRVDWTLTAFDGRRSITERQESDVYTLYPNCDPINTESDVLATLVQQHVKFAGCGSSSGVDAGPTPIPSLNTGTFLLAAIDPAAENQLLHLNTYVNTGRMLINQDTLRFDQNRSATSHRVFVPAYDVPILFHQQLPGQITLQATFAPIHSNVIDPQQLLHRGGFTYLARLPRQPNLFHGTVPLIQNDPQRFLNAILNWDGHTWQPGHYQGAGSDMFFLYTPSALTYQSTSAPAGQNEPAYTLVPSNTQNPKSVLSTLHLENDVDAAPAEVAFRTLHPLHIAETSQPPYITTRYFAEPLGQFTGESLSAQLNDPLNWLPETTYAVPPIVLRYDAQDRPLPPTTLIPTTNAAGFMLQPPLALTTLAAAEQIKGQQIISVIRIRVSGVDAANSASWKRIEQMAQLIQQRTNLRALVTLGSSPQPTLVYVPGIKQGQEGSTQNIHPVGWVEERWIYIGAALVYLQQLGETRFLLLGAVLLVCLGYLAVTLSAFVSAQRKEMAVLSALGWRPWQPAGMFLGQTLVLSLGGGIAGLGLALLVVWLLGADPPWEMVTWTLPIVLGFALLSASYPLWQIWRIRPAELLRAGTTVSSHQTSGLKRWGMTIWSRLPAVGSMALRNLTRSRWRAVIAIGSLFLSALLLTVMVEGILAFRQTLQGTLLGDYVLLQTAVPQIAGGACAVLLTFLSVADLLLIQVRERRQEIGLLQAVGWRPNVVRRLLMQEGLMLALVGTVPRVFAAFGVLMAQHAAQGTIPAPVVGIGAVVLMLLVAALATIPAVRATSRLQIADIMRAE